MTSRRARRLALGGGLVAAGLVALLLGALALLHLPSAQEALRGRLALEAGRLLSAEVQASSLRWNLSCGVLSAERLEVRGTGVRAGTLISVERLRVEFAPAALLRGRFRVRSLLVEGPFVRLRLDPEGRLVLPFEVTASPTKEKAGRPDVVLSDLRLAGGRIEVVDDGPAGRRIEAREVEIRGSAELATPSAKGTLSAARITVSGSGRPPLDGTSLRLAWSQSGDSANVEGRLEGKEAGLLVDLSGAVAGLGAKPSYEATLRASGTLEPLASRLVPGWRLSGAVQAELSAKGTFDALPELEAKGRVDGLSAFGRSLTRLDVEARTSGTRLVSGSAVATAGGGTVRLEASGTLLPAPKDLSFKARLDSLEVERLTGPLPGGKRFASLLSGSVEGRAAAATLRGTTLSAKLSLAPSGRPPARGAAPAGEAVLRLEKGVLAVDRLALTDRGTSAELSGRWEFDRSAFEGRLDLDAADISPWLALAGLPGSGAVNAHLAGRGTLARPALEGKASARALVVGAVRVDALAFDARLEDGKATIANGSVTAYEAEASASGEALLGRPLGNAKVPEAELRLSGVKVRGHAFPDVRAHASFGRTAEATLSTSDATLTANASSGPDGSFRIAVELSKADLGAAATLLPPDWRDATGRATGRLEASRPGRGGPLRSALRIDELSIEARGRRLALRQPAVARAEGGRLEISSFSLAGDDGSSLALSGTGALDGSALDLGLKAEVPDLAAWAAFVTTEKVVLGGRLSADVRADGTARRPHLRGSIAGKKLAFADVVVETAEIAFEPAPGDGVGTLARIGFAGARKGGLPFPEVAAEATVDLERATVSAKALDGRLRLSGSVGLKGPRPVTAELLFDAVEMGDGPLAKAVGFPKGIRAKVSGRASLRGPLSRPGDLEGELELSALEVSSAEGTLSAPEPVRLAVASGRLDVRSLRIRGESLTLDASGSLPIEGSGRDKLELKASLGLVALLHVFPFLDRAQGRLDVTLETTGSLSRPSFVGRAELRDGLLDGPSFPAPLEGLAGLATATPEAVKLESLSSRVAGGTVSVSGTLGLDSGRPGRLAGSMKVRDVDLSIGDDLQVRAAADLSAGGAWPELAVKGEVRIADATYVPSVDLTGMLKSLVRRKERGAAPSRAKKRATGGATVAFDVAIVAPEAFHVEGQMAEAELGGNLRLKGTMEDPVLLGTVSSTRGTVNLLGSVFDLTRARIEFATPTEIDPDLDIVGTTTKGDDEITARIMGRASKAQLLFSSSSGKSQADILKELVGGSGSGSTGSTSMADAAARMALQGATSSLFGALGTRTSLQIVPLPSTAEGEDFLFSVGKDLGGGLGVTYFKGQSGETSDAFEIRWRLSSRTRGRLRQNQDGSLSGGFRIRSEFH